MTTESEAQEAEPVPPFGKTCESCAHFTLIRDGVGAAGECRNGPPLIFPADGQTWPGQSWDLKYRWLDPRSPACSEWMSPEEWLHYRSGVREMVERLKRGETDVILGARP